MPQLGELWAIPIMLRLALIENLRRVAARVATSRVHQNMADDRADRMLAIADSDPKKLILVIADMARSSPPMSGAFVAALARRLPGQSATLALPLTWIEQQFAELGLTLGQLVQAKSQQQAVDQVCIGNGILGLWRIRFAYPPSAPNLQLLFESFLTQLAARGVAALSAKHPRPSCDTFFLFHRPRRWNPREGVWIGIRA